MTSTYGGGLEVDLRINTSKTAHVLSGRPQIRVWITEMEEGGFRVVIV